MSSSAALALLPELQLRLRDRAGETELLLNLASWAGQFTPSVALDFPNALTLEVSGSLRLFGGLPALLSRLRHGLAQTGHQVWIGVAPTPRAALWLARQALAQGLPAYGDATQPSSQQATEAALPPMLTEQTLQAGVAAMSINLLQPDAQSDAPLALACDALRGLGLRTLVEVLALPRDGLRQRFGPVLLRELDRALGSQPDPRTFFVPPPRFSASLELLSEVNRAEAVQFAAQRLLNQFAGYLAARSAGTRRFMLRLGHREGRFTDVVVGMISPARSAEHFGLLLRERLATLSLRQPVRLLRLEAEDIQPWAGADVALLPDSTDGTGLGVGAAAEAWPKLVERLRARLGDASVQELALAADHRPEHASVTAAVSLSMSPSGAKKNQHNQHSLPSSQLHASTSATSSPLPHGRGERPFWLLPRPRPLPERNAVPLHEDGPLALLAGPERIESGWWDGDDVARDYFVARTPKASVVWIYRERGALQGGQWYLHGLFA
jgi:protein ImuB